MSWTITCVCGWTVDGEEDEIVEATQEHGRRLHNMEVTREQAMAMASPSDS
jgi:predicted small metal-binding protein